MVHLILVLLNLLAVSTGSSVTTNIPETSSYSVDESTFDKRCPAVDVLGDKESLNIEWDFTCYIAANETQYTVSVIPLKPKRVDCKEDKEVLLRNVSAGESEVTISELAPYCDYQVNVSLKTYSGKVVTAVAVASTLGDDPPSLAVFVRGNNRSLHIKWNITGFIAANVTGYTVSVIPQRPKGFGCKADKEDHLRNVSAEEFETTISDLAPYHDYQVKVTVNTESGKQATGEAVASTSEGDVPPPIVFVQGDSKSLQVKWNITGCIAANVTWYTVSVIPQKSKDIGCEVDKKSHSRNVSAEESETTFSDLAPYHDYQVKVTVNTESGIQATGEAVASTSEGDVPPPEVIVQGDNKSLQVKWNITGCIAANVTGYTVSVIPQRSKDSGCEVDKKIHLRNVSAEESETTFSDLAPYQDYQVKVTVNTESGIQVTGEAVASTSEDDVPHPIVFVQGDSKSLQVKWNITGCIAANVTGYTVSVIPQRSKDSGCEADKKDHLRKVRAEESETTFSDLAPYHDYQVKVTVNTESGKQATGEAVASTSEDDVPPPQVFVQGDSKSLQVKWNITGCIAANVTGYTVSVIPQRSKDSGCEADENDHLRNVSAEESETTFSDLAPYQDYQVKVTVNTESGKQATGEAVASTSEGDVPRPEVFVQGDSKSLQVKWNITGCIAANVTGYTVSVIPQKSKGVGCKAAKKSHLRNVSAEESETTFSDLAPYHDYQVKVTVNTESGKQATGEAVASISEGDVPPPEVIVQGDNKSLQVKWNITGCIAANVTGYTVSVIAERSKGVDCEADKKSHLRNVSAEESETTFSDLAPYQDYQVKVTVNTESGKQATGEAVASTSEGDVPPPEVFVQGDSKSLQVKWNITGCIAANVTGYTVSVIAERSKGVDCEADKKSHLRNVSAEESETTFSDLAPYQDYQVKVTVNTESGKQATGEAVASTSEGDVPPPEVFVQGDSKSLQVKWNITGCIAANVTGYTVSVIPQKSKGVDCEADKKSHLRNVSAEESETTFSDLAPYHDYQVKVTVNTESGKQATGEAVASTSEGDVPPPEVFVQGDSKSLQVKWNITGCIAANVTGYTVSVIPQKSKGVDCEADKKSHLRNVSAEESETTFSDLAPYHDYQVKVTVNTESGKQATGEAVASTSEGDPPPPDVFVLGDNRSLHVQWNTTGCIAANVTGYTVSVSPLGPLGSDCKEDKEHSPIHVSAGESQITVGELAPYYDYHVNVTVLTESGKQATGEADAATFEDVPPRPLLKSSTANSLNIEVEWEQEKCVNGSVLDFITSLFLDGYRDENNCSSNFKNRTKVIAATEMKNKFEDLEPYAMYTIEIVARTGAGVGPPLILQQNTDVYTPEPVTDLQVTNLNPTNATVSWSKPCRINAVSVKYKVSFTGTRKDFEEHKGAETVSTENVVLTSLRPEYSYKIKVIAKNNEELPSEPESTTIDLPANIPRQKRSLPDPDPYATDDSTTKAKFTFSRDIFDPSDGCARYYAILVAESAKEPESGHLVDGEDCSQWETPEYINQATPLCWNPFPADTCNDAMAISYVIGDNASCSSDYCNEPLAPGRRYFVTVRVFTKSTYADAEYVALDTDSAINVGLIVGVALSLLLLGCCILISVLCHRRRYAWSGAKPESEMAREDSGSSPLIRRQNKRLSQRRGSRRKYRRLRSPRDSQDYEVSNWHRITPDVRTPHNEQQVSESGESDFTTRSVPSRFLAKSSESGQQDGSENSNLLRQQQQTAVRCPMLISEHGTDSCALDFSPKDSEEHSSSFIGSEDAYRTPPQRPPKMVLLKRQLDAQPKPVSLTKFPAYSDYMLGEPARISNEYHMLQTFSKDIAGAESCSTALQPENRRKNRYCNILPFDSTRVPLELLPDDPSSDYINASFIKGYSREVEYIATQGPKEETCFDFWRMVYQHGVKIIIMLTNLVENEKVKCCEYYPKLRENVVFGDITIRCTTELIFPIYTSRTFQLLKDDSQRSIVHLHFREWPDFGCPTSPDMMLQFSQTVRHQIKIMQPCLTVVHCSAGVGRTGTLITIDILLQHIKEHKKVDIFGTVFNLRRQRMFMVQSESQYVHIYHCIKEALLDPKFLESEKTSTSSTEPIYANIGNGHVSSTELQDCNNGTSGCSTQRVFEDGENETYMLITSGSSQTPSESECKL